MHERARFSWDLPQLSKNEQVVFDALQNSPVEKSFGALAVSLPLGTDALRRALSALEAKQMVNARGDGQFQFYSVSESYRPLTEFSFSITPGRRS